MYQFLFNAVGMYLLEAVVAALVTTLALLLYKKGKQEFVQRIVLALVTEAEKRYGNGTGELKYCHVVERLYEVLPWIIRILFTKEQIDNMIENAVEYLKRYLNEGRNLIGHGE